MLVKILKFQPFFTEEIAKLSTIGCKVFAHRFRDNFILVSADLLEGFYWVFFLLFIFSEPNDWNKSK